MTTIKTMKMSLLAVAVAVIAACGGGSNDPKAVAQHFLDALQKQDYAEAKKHATKESEEMLNTLESLAEMGGDAAKTEPKKVTISEVKEDGDNATATYTVEGEDGSQTLDLVKVDGDWKVEFAKPDMDMGGDEEWEDPAIDTTDWGTDTTLIDTLM
jgi:hypothetical protein